MMDFGFCGARVQKRGLTRDANFLGDVCVKSCSGKPYKTSSHHFCCCYIVGICHHISSSFKSIFGMPLETGNCRPDSGQMSVPSCTCTSSRLWCICRRKLSSSHDAGVTSAGMVGSDRDAHADTNADHSSLGKTCTRNSFEKSHACTSVTAPGAMPSG